MQHPSSRRAGVLAVLVFALALLALAPAALADTVTGSSSSPVFNDTSGGGGNNDALSLTEDSNTHAVTFHNSDAITAAPAGCTVDSPSPGDVTCAAPVFQVSLNMNGGDDTTTFNNIVSIDTVDQNGGDGNDTLGSVGSSFFSTSDGGAGDDSLSAPSGTLTGGPGNDTLSDTASTQNFSDVTMLGGPGTDVYNAGAAFDVVSYADKSAPVTASLDGGANDGEAGENENVPASVESLQGGDGNDTLTGSDGDNSLDGNAGDDTFNAGGGDDVVFAGDGNDTLNGGAGSDFLEGDNGNDVLNGNEGDDDLEGDAGADTYNGGDGIDTAEMFPPFNPSATGPTDQNVSLDGQANDGAAGENDNVAADIENVNTADGNDTITGTPDFNVLSGGAGKDTIDGSLGSDEVNGGTGDDTLRARDGYPDRVSCGAGADTAQVDQLDSVGGDCETVDRAQTDSPLQDRPPTVSLTAPNANASLPANTPTNLTANASDDKGVKQVVFQANSRVVCTDTTAPYSCSYQPTGDEVNRDTLTAVAVDTSDQAAFALRNVTVGLFSGTLSAKTTPKNDKKSPFKFKTSGKLALPAAAGAKGCSGTVTVTFKAGKKTVSTRRAKLSSKCTYSSKVTFKLSRRLHPKSLTVQARFPGNAITKAGASKRSTVKVR